MAPILTAVTDRVHFAQTDLVNWTLVAGSDEDGDGVMLIDAGFPGSRADVLDSLGQLGFGVPEVRAILLTHAHIDHFGSAIWFAETHGTPVQHVCVASERERSCHVLLDDQHRHPGSREPAQQLEDRVDQDGSEAE